MSIKFIRSLLAITFGLVLSKYTTYSFNFEIPIIGFIVVTGMEKFSLKKFVKRNYILIVAAILGAIAVEILRDKYFIFIIFSFALFFTCFYLANKNPKGSANAILGYSFTTIYGSYATINIENMVADIVKVTILGGVLGATILFLLPEKKENKENLTSEIVVEKKSLKTVITISGVVTFLWTMYLLFDIKDAFFAYATLAGIYANLCYNKIYKLSYMNILIHVSGCSIAIIYSFFINGISSSPLLFWISLLLLFYPMLYFSYFGDTAWKRQFSGGLIMATILPISLYLTPHGDIVSKSFARGFQITVMLLFSLIITRILLSLEGVKDEK